MMITMPAISTFLLATAMMRGAGDTVTPLWALAISTAIGLIVTPALIRGWFGLPSSAWSAPRSRPRFQPWCAAVAWAAHAADEPSAGARYGALAMRLDRELLGKVLRISVPTAIQLVAMSLAEIVLLGIVNGFDATAAYGAVNQVLSYAQFPAMSIAITASIFAAQAVGAGQAERIGPIVRTGMWLNLLLTGGLVAHGYLLS